MKKIILLILILFTVSACQSRMDVTDELKKTDGKIYHLTAPYKNTEITITFSGNRFSGFAGVNNYFGNIEINDNKIVNKLSVSNKELRIGDLKFIEK